jgi:hypothetical protein
LLGLAIRSFRPIEDGDKAQTSAHEPKTEDAKVSNHVGAHEVHGGISVGVRVRHVERMKVISVEGEPSGLPCHHRDRGNNLLHQRGH